MPVNVGNSSSYIRHVFSLAFDQDRVKSFAHCRHPGRSTARKWIENRSTGRRDKATQISHQVDRPSRLGVWTRGGRLHRLWRCRRNARLSLNRRVVELPGVHQNDQ